MTTPDDMERQIDEWAAHVHQKADRYQQLKQDLAKISASATVARGAITVTVGQSGLLTKLELTDQIRQFPAHYVADQIMSALRQAQATLGPQIVELMQTKVPEDAISIQTVQENYARQFPAQPRESFEDTTQRDRTADEILKKVSQEGDEP